MNEEKTLRSLADISASLDKLAISQARTDKEIDKLLRATRHMSNYIDAVVLNDFTMYAPAIGSNFCKVSGGDKSPIIGAIYNVSILDF